MYIRDRLKPNLLALFCCCALAASSQLMAGGYKIPENSVNSTALSAAYVANAHGADAAYFNPAAMSFNEDGALLEGNLTYIYATSIDYADNVGPFSSDSSEREYFLVPAFHYVSPMAGDARFGLSVVAPAGLVKRWNTTGHASAEEFTLKTTEINPTVSYKFNDNISAAIGGRAVYSSGVVKSDTVTVPFLPTPLSRDMDGDSIDYGYNLALLVKPTKELSFAATYRSKVDLTVEGDADIIDPNPVNNYSGKVRVSVPIPAAFNLAGAYTFNEATTVELVYERTYWSAYEELDFNYSEPLGGTVGAAFDASQIRDWSDADTYRIGVTHKLNGKWTLMAGFAYDETPVPERYTGFEMPDTDAKIYSVGFRYRYSDDLNMGAGLLYNDKEKLTLTPGDGNTGSSGALTSAEFENAAAFLFTMGIEYRF